MSILKDNPQRYGAVSQVLHWGLAILTIAAYITGENLAEAARADKADVMYWHSSLSVLVIVFFVVRAAWRTSQTSPEELNQNKLLALGHKLAVLALYALPIALTITGALVVQSVGRPVPFFGMELLAGWEPKDKGMHDLMETAHIYMAHAFIAILVLHTLAAAWHQFLKRDGGLARMLPMSLKKA